MSRLTAQDLLPNTKYAIQVRAIGNDITSEWSNRVLFTTLQDNVVPTAPTGFTWTTVGDSFHAEWDFVLTNVNGEIVPIDHYELELNDGTVIKTVSVSQQVTGRVSYDLSFENNVAFFFTPRATVYARVRAVDGRGFTSGWSTQLGASNPAPATPTADANAVQIGTDNISLRWLAVQDKDIAGYNVYVGNNAGFGPSNSNNVYQGNATQFTYVTTTYAVQYFKIRAYDKFNQESGDLNLSGTPNNPFVSDTTPPPVPSINYLAIGNNANGLGARVDIRWQSNGAGDDLAGFKIRYRQAGTSAWNELDFSEDTFTANIDVEKAYTNYEFSIRAYDASANFSAWTGVVTGNSPGPGVPVAVANVIATPGRDSITYRWNAAPEQNIREYTVLVSEGNNFSINPVYYTVGPNSTSLTVSGLKPNQHYEAMVRATNTGGIGGDWSAISNTTTLVWNVADIPGAAEQAAVTTLNAQIAQAQADIANKDKIRTADLTAPHKWLNSKYDGIGNGGPVAMRDVRGRIPSQVWLSDNPPVLSSDLGSNYIGHSRTLVVWNVDKTINNAEWMHDDAGAIYIDGVLVSSGPSYGSSYFSYTFAAEKYYVMDVFWNENAGGDGVDISSITSQFYYNVAPVSNSVEPFLSDQALQVANQGIADALAAQGTANSASNAATTAQGTANTAVTNASQAQTSANNAATAASNAQASAINAATAAVNAQNAANAALSANHNLLKGSRFNVIAPWANEVNTTLALAPGAGVGGSNALRVTHSSAGGAVSAFAYVNTEVGKQYVFSAYVKKSAGSAGVYLTSSVGGGEFAGNVTASEQRLQCEFTAQQTTTILYVYNAAAPGAAAPGTGDEFLMSHPKLEAGAVATAWSENPDEANDAAQLAQQAANSAATAAGGAQAVADAAAIAATNANNAAIAAQADADAALNANPNMLKNSSFEKNEPGRNDQFVTRTYVPALVNGTRAMQLTKNGDGDTYSTIVGELNLEAGVEYTVSWYGRMHAPRTAGGPDVQNNGGGYHSAGTYNYTDTETRRFSYSFVAQGTGTAQLIYRTSPEIGGFIVYDGVKVEKGNTATAWTLNPQDALDYAAAAQLAADNAAIAASNAATAAANAQGSADDANRIADSAFNNPNPYFRTWPNGNPVPDGFAAFGAYPSRDTVYNRSGSQSVHFNLNYTDNGGFSYGSSLGNQEYVTIETEFYLKSGLMPAAGVLIDWYTTTGNFRQAYRFNDFGTYETGRWYRIVKTVKRPDNIGGTFNSLGGYIMAQWDGLYGGRENVEIIFDHHGMRAATVQEIEAYNAKGYTDQKSIELTTNYTALVGTLSDNVYSAVNGKNKIVTSSATPSGTAYIDGDAWYQYSANNIVGMWIWRGGAWQQQILNDSVIGNLNAAKITVGILDAARIGAETISTRKLAIGDPTNYVPDFNDPITRQDYNSVPNFTWSQSGDMVGDGWRLLSLGSGAANGYGSFRLGNRIDVLPGDKFYFASEYYKVSNVNYRAELNFVGYDKGGNIVAYDLALQFYPENPSDSWIKVDGVVEIPTSVYYVIPEIKTIPSSSGSQDGFWYFRNTEIRKQAAGKLIVDGDIEGRHLKVNSIDASKLNVQVGGGNLLSKSFMQSDVMTSGRWSTQIPYVVSQQGSVVSYDSRSWWGQGSLKIAAASGANDSFVEMAQPYPPTPTQGLPYILSAMVYVVTAGSENTALRWNLSTSAGNIDDRAAYDPTKVGQWQRVWTKIFVPASSTVNGWNFIRLYSNFGSVLLFDGIQFEQGDFPTSYSPKTDEILPGTITGDMLQANTALVRQLVIGSGGALKSSNYINNQQGWLLSENGLDINNGSIKASALNITVGGGNLLTNSDFSSAAGYLTDWITTDPTGTFRGEPNIVTAHRGGYSVYVQNNQCLYRELTGLAPNRQYTLSAWIYSEGNTHLAVHAGPAGGYANQVDSGAPGTFNGYAQRVSVVFTTTASGSARPHLYGPGYYSDVQFEEGDYATAYAPKTDEILPGTIRSEMVSTERLSASVIRTEEIIVGQSQVSGLPGTISGINSNVSTVQSNLDFAKRLTDTSMTVSPVPYGTQTESYQVNYNIDGNPKVADAKALDGVSISIPAGNTNGGLLYGPYYSRLKPGRYKVTYYLRTSRATNDTTNFAYVSVYSNAGTGGVVEQGQNTFVNAKMLAMSQPGEYGSVTIPLTIRRPLSPGEAIETYVGNVAGDWAFSHVIISPADDISTKVAANNAKLVSWTDGDGTSITGTMVKANTLSGNALIANTVTANSLNVVIGGGNLLSDGGFESGSFGTHGWAVSGTGAAFDNQDAVSGSKKRIISRNAGFDNHLLPGAGRNTILVRTGQKYTLSAWVYKVTGATEGSNRIMSIDHAATYGGSGPFTDGNAGDEVVKYVNTGLPVGGMSALGEGWVRLKLTFTAQGSYVSPRLYLSRENAAFYWDNVQLEEGELPTTFSPKSDEILPGTIVGNMIQAETGLVTNLYINSGGSIRSSNYNPTGGGAGWAITENAFYMRSGEINAETLKSGTTITNNLGVTGQLVVSSSGTIQSSNYSSTAGYRISQYGIQMNDANSRISASALDGGTISASSAIVLGSNANLIVNGGSIKSSNYDSGGGFIINSSGIRMLDANSQIRAEAFIGGNFSGGTLTLTGAGVISGPGYTLSSSGLNVTSGTISASALTITTAFSNSITTSATTISGDIINTGTIRSTQLGQKWNPTTNAYETDNTRWAWELKTTADGGIATFSKANVTGSMVVGSTPTDSNSVIASSNFQQGSAGWQIRGDGVAEFRQVVAKSFDGQAIRTDSLDVATLKSGNMGASINILGGISVTNPTSKAIIGMSASEGFFVRGPIPSGQTKGPTYIAFPLDGQAPNIISGVLQATTLSVAGGSDGVAATFYQNSTISNNSQFSLSNPAGTPGAGAPSAGPTWVFRAVLDAQYGETRVTPLSTFGDGYVHALYRNSSYAYTIRQFDMATGVQNYSLPLNLGNVLTPFSLVKTASSWVLLYVGYRVVGSNGYYTLSLTRMDFSGNVQGRNDLIYTTEPAASSVAQARPTLANAFNSPDNADLIFGMQNLGNASGTDHATSAGNGKYNFKTFYSTAITGSNQPGAAATYMSTVSYITGIDLRVDSSPPPVTGIYAGNADFGSFKIIPVLNNYAGGDYFVLSATPNSGSSVATQDNSNVFNVGSKNTSNLAYYNDRFYGFADTSASELSNNSAIVVHSTIKWTAGTTTRWGIGTTKYDRSNGYQSTLGSIYYFTMKQRAWVTVTPDFGGVAAARIYIGRRATGSLTNAEMFWVGANTVSADGVYTSDVATFSGTVPPTSSTYPTAGILGGQIVSAYTDSLEGSVKPAITIRGDGYARFANVSVFGTLNSNNIVSSGTISSNNPIHSMYYTSQLSVTQNAWTQIPLTTNFTRGGSNAGTLSGSVWTCAVSGYYDIMGMVSWSVTGGSATGRALTKVERFTTEAPGSGYSAMLAEHWITYYQYERIQGVNTLYINAGEKFRLVAYQAAQNPLATSVDNLTYSAQMVFKWVP